MRPVEAFPVRMGDQSYLCLRDSQGLAEQSVFLNQMMAFLVSRMDGKHSLRDIQADYCRATGEILPIESITNLVKQLDEQHYLDSPLFQKYCQALAKDFQKAPSRPAQFAGTAYEKGYDALTNQISSYFASPEGPGNDSATDALPSLRGLIAPHIDFLRGGATYAHAYKALADHPGADTFIIFGTCHAPMQQRLALTFKDYETPLGLAKTNQEFVGCFAAKLQKDYFLDEFSHRGEHSIEFQAVCLRYILGKKQGFRIIPVLVNSFHDIYAEGKTAADDRDLQNIIEAIRETMAEIPGRYCIIAGVDLAHVGRRFGDPAGPTEYSLREVEQKDRIFLELVAAGDAEGMFRLIAEEHDQRRVCGYPSIYLTLRCLEKPQGKLLQYRQWADLAAGAAVSYAALALF